MNKESEAGPFPPSRDLFTAGERARAHPTHPTPTPGRARRKGTVGPALGGAEGEAARVAPPSSRWASAPVCRRGRPRGKAAAVPGFAPWRVDAPVEPDREGGFCGDGRCRLRALSGRGEAEPQRPPGAAWSPGGRVGLGAG